MLPRRARVDLGIMAMNGCSAFPKAPALLEPYLPTPQFEAIQVVENQSAPDLNRDLSSNLMQESRKSYEIY